MKNQPARLAGRTGQKLLGRDLKLMSDNKPVCACLCYPHTFVELKTRAAQQQWCTVGEITEALGCGGGCGLCAPYLKQMLQTGETAFAILPTEKIPVKKINSRRKK